VSAPVLTWEHRDPGAELLIVTNMWPHEGDPVLGIFVKRQVDALRASGVACDVLFVRGFVSKRAYLWGALKLLAWNLRPPRRYRLVHGHGGETALVVRSYLRCPVLVSYCGDDLLGTPDASGAIHRKSRVRRGLQRLHASLLTASITKSEEMERCLPRHIRHRNLVLPNGVDTASFRPRPRDAARAELGWPADERVALFAGKPAVERKRHWLAEEACERAAADVPDVRLRVAAGVDPARVETMMNAADLLLLTSAVEGSPNVVKEALMCNLPVVATAVGDVPELLEGVEPSYVCGDDPAELAAAIVACLREGRRSNGREAKSHLDASAVNDRLVRLYRDLGLFADGRGAPV
jgi:glycosyltransferase involved in cell wall biosynthesis